MDTARTMITFRKDDITFTYRIGGIAIHNNKILFQRATLDPDDLFWFLPGGRAELGESSEETLRREMLEELDVSAQIERPLFVMENFFSNLTGSHHELGLYFLMTLPPDCYLCQQEGPYIRAEEDNLPMIFDWLPIDDLERLRVRPKFFRTALHTLPEHLVHVPWLDA